MSSILHSYAEVAYHQSNRLVARYRSGWTDSLAAVASAQERPVGGSALLRLAGEMLIKRFALAIFPAAAANNFGDERE